MKKILLIATIYRVGERIYPIIPKLSGEFHIDVLKTAQMGNKINWYGDNDLRIIFDKKYQHYINNIYYDVPNLNNYDLILMDDDRPRNGLKQIYDKVNVPVIGHQHGNSTKFRDTDIRHKNYTSWDYTTVFGKKEKDTYVKQKGIDFNKRVLLGGIPANDLLNKYERTNKHILIIVNFLGNTHGYGFKPFDETTFKKIGVTELQKKYNKKIIIKIKSRKDLANPKGDFEYLKKVLPKDLDYEIIMDTDDDNKLVSDSSIVISAPSVLAFKPIQKGIPTILLKDYGQTGQFYDFKGLIELDTQTIFDEIERQCDEGKEEDFIKHTIEGGIDFNSTEKYINCVRKFL